MVSPNRYHARFDERQLLRVVYVPHRLILLVEAYLARASWLLFQCHPGKICGLGNIAVWLLFQHYSPKTTSQPSYPHGSYSHGVNATSYKEPHPGSHFAFCIVHSYLQSSATQGSPLHNLCYPASHGSCCTWSLLYLDSPHQEPPLPTRVSYACWFCSPQLRGINGDAVDLFSQLSRWTSSLPISQHYLSHHLAIRSIHPL